MKSDSLVDVIDAAERVGKLNLREEEIASMLQSMSDVALKQALRRQRNRGRLIRLSRGAGHWLIVPLQYADSGSPPLEVWLDRYLTKTLGLHYYVGLLSAAEVYGASPYAVMVTQVMVAERRRALTVGRHELVFHNRARIEDMPVRWHDTAEGRFKVSSPELTALELMQRVNQLGGLARVQAVLRGLQAHCTPSGLEVALNAVSEVTAAQRLGALLSLDGRVDLSDAVGHWLSGKPMRLVSFEESAVDGDADKCGLDAIFKVRLPVDIKSSNA